jgi:dienelactone hydrolase
LKLDINKLIMEVVMIKIFLAAALLIGCAITAEAAVKTKVIEYKQGDAVLEGFLAWDDAKTDKRPGVLVVHEWTGLGPYVKKRTEMLAKMGYVAFAADIYGKGIRPSTPAEAAKTATIYKDDRPLLRARAKAGLDTLKAQKYVDQERIAAIGYCFGGTTVLELARDGANILGVVSFQTRRCQEHQGQGPGAPRRRRPLCQGRRGSRLPGGDAEGRRGLAVR